MRDGRGGQLGDERVRAEALERERRDQRRASARSRRARPASSPTIGAALKPYVPQPVETWKPSTSVSPEDRAVVGGEVAEARPLRAAPSRSSCGKSSSTCRAEYSRNGNVLGAAVGRVRLDLGADQELAAVGLRDVHVHLRRHDDHVEERLDRLGHERLQDVRRDRQAARRPGRRRASTSRPSR